MGFLKRRHKGSNSDDYMWLDPQRLEHSPSAPSSEEPASPPPSMVQPPPAPPPPIPVETTSQPEEGTRSA